MGKKNSDRFRKTLHEQVYDQLQSMIAIGKSRNEAKLTSTDDDKIFSIATIKTYKNAMGYFVSWLGEEHPNITSLKKAKRYVPEWLQSVADSGASAYTISTYRAAANKILGIRPGDSEFYCAPQRKRKNITRSRLPTKSDAHFSVANNADIIAFGCGTGLRKTKELAALRGGDIASREQLLERLQDLENDTKNLSVADTKIKSMVENALLFPDVSDYVFVRSGKGGRPRLAPIIGPDADKIAARIRSTSPDRRVWEHVPKAMDEHALRAEYCCALYKMYARPIDTIPYDAVNAGSGKKYQSDVYFCRSDDCGKKLDKKAMYLCSLALGHNRISVVAGHYLYGI